MEKENDLILPVVFEADVSGHLNSKYSGSDKNTAGENGFSFDSRADFGILDAVSGNESVHASPDTEVSCANSFSGRGWKCFW